MGVFDHWHPVLPSTKLRKRPVGVRLAGRHLVLFRGTDARPAALDDVCPHRRMRLSAGSVVGGRLQCPYHGWTFDCAGRGESPATPKLHARCGCYEVADRHGFLWVRARGARTDFPRFDTDGWYNVCNLEHVAQAPLEITLDNFCEIEHTPTTHAFFGYPLERMHEVQVRFETTDDTVRVVNVGPSKPISLPMRFILGIRKRYVFNDDWTTHFSPVYSVYDHWWSDPETGKEGWVRWRLYIFFTPLSADETALTTFAFTKSRWPGSTGAVRYFRWLVRRKLDHEIRLDQRILANLADKSPGIEGMKLSRFDRVLWLNRERIDRVYRGGAASLRCA
jgi:vanillate O-demethylase monooxygenase subunit